MLEDTRYEVRIRRHGNIWQCKIRKNDGEFSKAFIDPECTNPQNVSDVVSFGSRVAVFSSQGTFEFTVPDPLEGEGLDAGGDTIVAPMPGLVKKVMANSGNPVAAGDPLVVLEAMKMEHVLSAPRDGALAEVNVSEGDQVEDGTVLVRLESEDG